MKKFYGWVPIVLVALIPVAWYFSSAYWAVSSLESAARNNDLKAIEEKVDLASVGDGLKKSAGPGKSRDFLTIVGSSVATIVTGPLIDSQINPANVAKIIRSLVDAPPPSQKGELDPRPAAHMHYENIDLFVVDLVEKLKEGKTKTTSILFQRQGLFGWKLTSVRMP